MNDPFQEICREALATFQRHSDEALLRIRKYKRQRIVFSILPVPFLLFSAGMAFYRLDYGWGIFDCIMAMFFASLNWWLWSGTIASGRQSRRHAASCKLQVQEQLDLYRKERGF
jgi:hypothetical protein